MSRIGKIPVDIPQGVKTIIEKGTLRVEGPKGTLTVGIPNGINVEQQETKLVITRKSEAKQNRANHGTIRALLNNMVQGVTHGHKKELEIKGVGLRAQLQEKKIVFSLGFSHPIEFTPPPDVSVTVPTQTSVIVEGIDKAIVGQVAAKIRDFKKPEPYKGKGIRYVGEIVKRKQGKSVTK